MRNRKIVHLVYSLGYGGLEQVIVNLINNTSQYNARHIIITLTSNHDLYSAIEPDVSIYNLNKKPGKDFISHIRLFALLRKLQADVINTYNFGTVEYHYLAFLAGIKTRIHSEHGRGGDDPDGLNFWHNLLRKFSILFMESFIVVSPDLLKWGKKTLNINNEKLKIIYNGVNTSLYHPSPEKNAVFTICTVGRADPVKNQKFLIDAYKLAIEKFTELNTSQLQIIGDGPNFNQLKAYVQEIKMDGQIHLLGYRNDVAELLNKANLFILSSIYEAMPMTILEAMACELPVISTKVGGVEHMINDEQAWLIESNNTKQLADTIISIYKHPEESKDKALKGRQITLNNYSIDKMVASYMNLYHCEQLN